MIRRCSRHVSFFPLLLFNPFAAASASHGLSGDKGLMPVCTTTGIKYVKAPEGDDARVPEQDARAGHCVLCMLSPPHGVSFVPARQFVAHDERSGQPSDRAQH